jgi:hypothetical protein
MPKHAPETRIGIIGAGAAGLSAAHYLRQQGYTHVTVLEKEAQVGGKCHTVHVDGRAYDLGAFTLTWGYKHTLALARAKKIPLTDQPIRQVFNRRTGEISSIRDALLKDYSLLALSWASLRYLLLLFRYRRFLGQPGFRGLAQRHELTIPFGEWVRRKRLLPLLELMRLPVKDMGYGDPEQIPVAYILKYISFWNFITLMLYGMGWLHRWPKRFVHGFQSLWKGIAADLDVRLGVTIERIERTDGRIRLFLAGQPTPLEYDHLILACPLDKALPLLASATPAEKRLFSQIQYQDYFVTLGRAPNVRYETIDALHGLRQGHVWEMMRSWPQSNVCVFYGVGDGQMDGRDITRFIEQDVPALYPGGYLEKVETQIKWPYFPHVSAEALRQGYYDELEDLQGTQNTYYTGGLLAFEVVENVVAYSHALVQRFF